MRDFLNQHSVVGPLLITFVPYSMAWLIVRFFAPSREEVAEMIEDAFEHRKRNVLDLRHIPPGTKK